MQNYLLQNIKWQNDELLIARNVVRSGNGLYITALIWINLEEEWKRIMQSPFLNRGNTDVTDF
jgi:hypothetical protein